MQKHGWVYSEENMQLFYLRVIPKTRRNISQVTRFSRNQCLKGRISLMTSWAAANQLELTNYSSSSKITPRMKALKPQSLSESLDTQTSENHPSLIRKSLHFWKLLINSNEDWRDQELVEWVALLVIPRTFRRCQLIAKWRLSIVRVSFSMMITVNNQLSWGISWNQTISMILLLLLKRFWKKSQKMKCFFSIR